LLKQKTTDELLSRDTAKMLMY